ncbi:hypothetical protein [Nocardia sp. NPDC052566]
MIEQVGVPRSPNTKYRRTSRLFDDPVFDELLADDVRDNDIDSSS